MRFKTAYDHHTYDEDNPRVDYTALLCLEPTMTEQCHKEACDINNILTKYNKVNGVDFLKHSQGFYPGEYGDFSDVGDYRTALDRIRASEASFMSLPSKVRARFNNDPGQFLDFALDTANRQEMVDLGLAHVVQKVEPKDPAE